MTLKQNLDRAINALNDHPEAQAEVKRLRDALLDKDLVFKREKLAQTLQHAAEMHGHETLHVQYNGENAKTYRITCRLQDDEEEDTE